MAFTYKFVPNFLSNKECELILKFSIENLKLMEAEVLTPTGKSDSGARKSGVAFYPYYKTFPFLKEKINKELIGEINVKGFDLEYENSEFQFTKYEVGDFFEWHKDVIGDTITQKERYCSMVIQLNDAYENGNLEIKTSDNDETITIEKGIGNLIIFLSDMNHRVTDVTSGNRYTLVNWIGLREKKNFKKTLL
jgi:Rps23 Pro-64 3,4-dihydroxylase Tpa1-like proline 4-hydroxylase